jgi:acyl-coenzyme A thioesterase PaaI-like protein
MKEVAKYAGCFVCGDRNTRGLNIKFHFDGHQVVARVTAERAFEGYRNIYHGGIISTVLDEVMIKAILAEDIFAVTAEMTVKFKEPVQIGDDLTFTGRVIARKGRLFFTKGEVVGRDGLVYASATGKYIRARDDLRERLLDSIEDPSA